MQDLQLEHVSIIHRHGARSPVFNLSHFPFLPHFDHCKSLPAFHKAVHKTLENHLLDIEFDGVDGHNHLNRELQKVSKSKCFEGQLTDAGKLQMKNLGWYLRSNYIKSMKLLPEVANGEDIYLRSTNYIRTLESLQYLLLGISQHNPGLFPKHTIDALPKVLVKDTLDENLYPNDRGCPSMMKEIKEFRESFQDNAANRFLLHLTPLSFWHTMQHSSFANQTYRLYDVLSCMKGNNIPYPEGIDENHRNNLEELTIDLWARSFAKNTEFTKQAIGRFIPDLVKPLLNYQNDLFYPKLSIYSAHDSSLIPIMIAFDTFDGRFPQFADHIAFELHKTKAETKPKQSYVRMLFNGEPMKIPACQSKGNHLPNDSSFCILQAFLDYGKSMSISEEEFRNNCKSSGEPVVPDWD